MASFPINYYFCILGAVLLRISCAQQLSGAKTYLNYPGLSPACLDALATDVSCPPFLRPASMDGEILDSGQVTELCTDNCYSSLENVKHTIDNACTAKTDVIVYRNIAYPASFIVDNFLYTYNVSCKKDRITGEFCDPQFLAWSAQPYLNSTQACSDCWLGVKALQMGSPLGYDPALASNLASLTSSCNVTSGYGYTSPTPYAINSTATTAPATVVATPAPTCTGSYTVQEADDFNSIALAYNVSTYDLLTSNNLDLYGQNFVSTINSTLCLPAQCDTYVWQALDSCDSVTRSLDGVTVPQFLSWNPNFSDLCGNRDSYIGYVVCMSPPGGHLNSTSTSSSNSTDDNGEAGAVAPMPAPTNAMNGTTTRCGDWHTVRRGDTCAKLSITYSISLSDFYFLNPQLNRNCSNLEVDKAYCVQAVGTITTYPGYPKTVPLIIVTPATFPSVYMGIPTTTSDPGYTATYSYLPTASGTSNNCTEYRNYDTKNDLNSCRFVVNAYSIDTNDFLAWNPSLSSNMSACRLQPGYSYCVEDANSPSPSY